MLERDQVCESKTGRISAWIISLFVLVMGLIVVIVSLIHFSDMDTDILIPGCMGIVFGVIGIMSLKRKQKAPMDDLEEVSPGYIPEPLEGEPDEQIVVSPTRINESTGSIFVYRDKGILVYNGVQFPLDSISDVSFNNVAPNPYVPGEYHILLILKDGRVLHIPAGMDRIYAQEVAMKLRDACELFSQMCNATGVGTVQLFDRHGKLVDRIHAENIGCENGESDK